MANLIRRTDPREAPARRAEWDPFQVMSDMLGWDPFRAPFNAGLPAFTPQFDVRETKEGYVFEADLPGVKEEDVEVTLTGNRLTVSGRREAEQREEGENVFALERSYGSFSRSFTLPDGIDPDAVNAELKNGVLTLQVGKRPENQPRKIALKGVVEQGKGKAHA